MKHEDTLRTGVRASTSCVSAFESASLATSVAELDARLQEEAAEKAKVEKERLYNLKFVSLNQNSTSQRFQTQTLKENGLNPKMLHVQMEFNSIEAIKSAVQHGLGAAFVSQSAIQKEVQLGLLHSSTIQDVVLTRRLQVVTNRKRYFSRAAQCFTQEILTAPDWYGIQQSSENRFFMEGKR